MEHTKGKLRCEYHEQSDAYIVLDENKNVVALHCTKANADHLVKCWNCHDQLLEACQTAKIELEQRYGAAKGSAVDRAALKVIKTAIAEANDKAKERGSNETNKI